jgi:hypothetical protein
MLDPRVPLLHRAALHELTPHPGVIIDRSRVAGNGFAAWASQQDDLVDDLLRRAAGPAGGASRIRLKGTTDVD